jgi:hypothetical protein
MVMLSSKKSGNTTLIYSMKKCPYCYSMLKLNADKCDICKKRLGAINKIGFAEKRVDWKAYLIAIVASTAFITYIWWAFLKS